MPFYGPPVISCGTALRLARCRVDAMRCVDGVALALRWPAGLWRTLERGEILGRYAARDICKPRVNRKAMSHCLLCQLKVALVNGGWASRNACGAP